MREWLEPARTGKGLTQLQMAAELKITESGYSMIERGVRQKKMKLPLVLELSRILGIPVTKIIEYEARGRGTD